MEGVFPVAPDISLVFHPGFLVENLKWYTVKCILYKGEKKGETNILKTFGSNFCLNLEEYFLFISVLMFLSTGMFNMHCIHLVMVRLHVPIEEGWKQKARQRSSRLFGGQNLFNSLPHLLFCLGQFERKGLIHPTFLQINRGKTASAARN